GVPGARWTPEENVHVTLKFIGEIDEGLAADIDEALAEVQAAPFTMALAGVGAFDRRLIWAGVEPADPINALRRKVETAAARAGAPRSERRYAPHATIARVKQGDPTRIAGFLSTHALFRSEAFAVESFALISSVLGREQARHRVEVEYPLG
ncbi:MAG: RNA 2',3'-cyclic phosphodiesterase, partial [Pseudomonadota bacterium]